MQIMTKCFKKNILLNPFRNSNLDLEEIKIQIMLKMTIWYMLFKNLI